MSVRDEIEPRIAERRQKVTEERARRRLLWVVAALAVIVVAALGYWLLRSPLLSIREVTATGAVRSDPVAIAAAAGVTTGIPTISVDTAAAEAALAADPWIADADVVVSWPGSVTINVVERIPIAVARGDGGSALVASDGTILEEGEGPPPHIVIGGALPRAGGVVRSAGFVAAVEFVAVLDADLAAVTEVVVSDASGLVSLSAVVAGHEVRLGRPVEMALKAAALEALFAAGLPEGSYIDLNAPTRPAVGNPRLQQEGETESLSQGEPSG